VPITSKGALLLVDGPGRSFRVAENFSFTSYWKSLLRTLLCCQRPVAGQYNNNPLESNFINHSQLFAIHLYREFPRLSFLVSMIFGGSVSLPAHDFKVDSRRRPHDQSISTPACLPPSVPKAPNSTSMVPGETMKKKRHK